MRNDSIFVLLLVVLLPMPGCLDGGTVGVGEAEGAQGSDTTTILDSPERTWYSSGGTYFSYWNDGQSAHSWEQRCLDYGSVYDSSTGEYLGEDCLEIGFPMELSDWNVTDCTTRGGQIDWSVPISTASLTAPKCVLEFTTLATVPGEALLIYQISGLIMTSVCDGVGVTVSAESGHSLGSEYVIIPGSASNCTHEFTLSTSYSKTDGSAHDYTDRQGVWSIVYAIQDTMVV